MGRWLPLWDEYLGQRRTGVSYLDDRNGHYSWTYDWNWVGFHRLRVVVWLLHRPVL